MSTPPRTEPRQMSRTETLVFASGDVFGGGGGALISVLYLFYLTDVIGLLPALAGGVIAVARVAEAVMKPFIGQWSDNTRTRWGRRRPFLVIGSVLVLLAEALLWLPTGWIDGQFGKAAYAMATIVGYMAAAALVTTPYTSMSSETTTDPRERTRLNLVRLFFSSVSSATVFVVGALLIKALQRGQLDVSGLYLALAVGFGLLFSVPVLSVGIVARERTPFPATRSRFSFRRMAVGLQVRSYRILLGMYLCAGLMMDTVASLVLAYSTYVAPIAPAVFMAIMVAVQLVAVAVVTTRLKHVSKNKVYGTLIPLAVLAMTGICLWPANLPTWPIYLLCVLLAAGAAGTQMMTWVMFGDVVDDAELQQGTRHAGSLTALMTFARSIGTATLALCIGLVLQASGYQGSLGSAATQASPQPASALWAIRLTMLTAVAGFLSLGWWLARRYPLIHDVALHNAEVLAARRREDLEVPQEGC